MGRRPRIDLAGFHHLINRGIDRSNIYRSDEDKENFLEILCKACSIYKVNVHDYCLMDNHYHLLVKTTSENLSFFMRQVNSNYAKYFNKKYKRTGYLWQGRYSSWYITSEQYLYDLFRYIEHNPIEAKMTNKIGEYPFTLLATVINSNQKPIKCAAHSKLKREIKYDEIREHLQMKLTQEELDKLQKEQNRKVIKTEHEYRYAKKKSLEEHFTNCSTKDERNRAIINAIKDDYKQVEIARFLTISSSAVSKVVVAMNK